MIYFIKNMSVKKKPGVGLKDIIKQQNWLANALIPMYCQFLIVGNDSNLLIVFYVQIMPDDLVMQLHRF
ncbi:hypothetical protein CSW68_26165 [Shigella boydii]|nr:hypothetical protein CSW72_26010 [Shigella boydii]PHU81803.1 hypothetical protein CSW68_26165 [Shigella boydii]PHU90528.1 hypothetical protein CSW67_26395 [Shigella boydii]